MSRVKALNNEACDLLECLEYRTAVGLLKEALTELKKDISRTAMGHVFVSAERIKRSDPRIQSSGKIFFFHQTNNQFQIRSMNAGQWIYNQPLWILPGESDVSNSLVFAITFNLALACHLLATEFENCGVDKDARQYYYMARNLYQLPLKMIQEDYKNDNSVMDRDLFLFAAILNNASHVHSFLEEEECALVYRHQLVKALFFFVDAGMTFATTSHDGTGTLDYFFENVKDLVCRIDIAPAA
ncbi:hypothetical protein IV203_021793 [Nitzschia inconspicua]|uniref:Uncharacterized protein n=1 Tax=Nitzschia inconspicua TaxID=303405 RepID=A0A9K3KID7_9STRA|nr:hypothetical protein IV203_021793 [Nitzschia inconspicua]